MKKKLALAIIILAAASACHNGFRVKEIKDRDMVVQVMRLDPAPGDGGTLTYKARLLPVKAIKEDQKPDERIALWLRMDSCFYLQSGQHKVYASLVQPVANGVKGSYEFLIEFDPDSFTGNHSDLVYQDKFLNHREYRIKLND